MAQRLPGLLALAIAASLAVFALARSGAGLAGQPAAPSQSAASLASPAQRLGVDIVSVRSHDPSAFTQGLLLLIGLLYESTGLVGTSTPREVDPLTGEVLRRVDVPAPIFAEGLALFDDVLIQLTWQSGVALVYDLASFERIGEFHYSGEGWGLCYDGERL